MARRRPNRMADGKSGNLRMEEARFAAFSQNPAHPKHRLRNCIQRHGGAVEFGGRDR